MVVQDSLLSPLTEDPISSSATVMSLAIVCTKRRGFAFPILLRDERAPSKRISQEEVSIQADGSS